MSRLLNFPSVPRLLVRLPLLLPLVLVLPLLLTSCYKDDVQIELLTTNPLDPDYTGAPMFTIVSDLTYQPTPGVYEQVLEIQVDEDRLPYNLAYSLRVVDVESGDVTIVPQSAPGAHLFEYFRSSVTLGQTYCYDMSLYVQLSAGREEQYCGVAEL